MNAPTSLLSGLEFAQPYFLLTALLAPYVYWRASRRVALATFSSLALVASSQRSLRERLGFLPPLLLGIATLALAIALAGPRTGNAVSEVEREGIAIAVVVDRSGSMDARDFVEGDYGTSRLDVVKRIFKDFVEGGGPFGEGRPDDLIGIIAFARHADGLCPLTLDHGSVLTILDELTTPREADEDGTAVGDALALAVERLRRQDTKTKIAILLTDGVHNAGDVEPLEAAELAARFGIKVYTIGAGYNGFAPFPVRRADGTMSLERVAVEIDEASLRQIAEKSGGRYFHATDETGLREVVAEIGELERSKVAELRYLEYAHHYRPFVVVAAGCLLLSWLLGATWLRRLPA